MTPNDRHDVFMQDIEEINVAKGVRQGGHQCTSLFCYSNKLKHEKTTVYKREGYKWVYGKYVVDFGFSDNTVSLNN